MKTLIVAEKPSAAREYKAALEKKYDKFTKGSNSERFFENSQFIITWARGHLLSSLEPRDYDHFEGWKLDALPIYPPNGNLDYKIGKDTSKDFKDISGVLQRKDVSEIVNGCDPGREGELIFWEMYDYLKLSKPVKRLWCPSMTEDSILEAFDDLKNEAFSFPRRDAAYARAYADWVLGMNLTIGFSVKANRGKALHVGRVQTPTIALLAQRRKEIDDFKPQKYFEIEANFGGKYKGMWFKKQLGNTRFDTKEDAEAVVAKIQNKTGKVIKKEVKKQEEGHKLLYSLTTLQQEANNKFGFTADETLQIAQSLYETHKILSYPRSDSNYLGKDHVKTLQPRIQAVNVANFSTFASHILSTGIKTTKRFVDDSKLTDHHAIIPTEAKPNLSALSSQELKIYELVVKRFLSVFYPNAIYEKTEIVTEVENETFKTSGKIEIDPGWKVVYGAEADDEEEDKKGTEKEAKLPPIDQDETNDVQKTELLAKDTKPPKHYTDATLLAAMANPKKFLDDKELQEALQEADAGLGTPATRAAVIKSIIARGYVERQKKNIVATDLGMQLIEVCPEELKSPEITAEWEQKLNFIQEEKLNKVQFVKEIHDYVERNLVRLKNEELSVSFKKEGKNQGIVAGTCPECNSDVMERNIKVKDRVTGKEKPMKMYACVNASKEDPCFVMFEVMNGKKISMKHIKQLMKNKKTDSIEGFVSQKGTKFSAPLVWDEKEKKVKFDFSAPEQKSSGISCPICSKGSLNELSWGYGCSNYKEGCKFSIGKEMFGKKITMTIVKEIASKKKTKKMDGFVSKAGKAYSASLVLDEKEKKVKLSFE